MIRGIVAGVVTGALAVAGLSGPAAAAPARGTVRGAYTTDAGAPIAGATVWSSSIEYNNWQRAGTTDALGRYEIVDVPPGPAKLQFYSEGIAQWAPRTTDPAAAATYTVLAGLTLVVDERQLPMGSVRGRVTTAAGAPIGNASVTAHSGSHRRYRSTRTDADGRYSIAGIPAGPVKVEFYSGGFYHWARGAADFASATTFTVPGGGSVTADETRFPTGTITGRFTDAAGVPQRYFTAGAAQVGSDRFVTAQVASDGRYTVEVPAGQWRIRLAGSGQHTPQWAPGKPDRADGEVFTVAPDQTVTVGDVAQLPTGSLGGRLTRADGRGMGDETVDLWRGGERVGFVYTDSEGTYDFGDVIAGDYRIAYDTDYFLPGTVRPDRADVFTVPAGRPTVVDARAPMPGKLSGKLTVPGGAPAAGIGVRSDAVTGTLALQGQATTAADGSWEINGVFPEDYQISFVNPEGTLRQYAGDLPRTVPPGGSVTVDEVWQTGATLTIAAVDAATGEPVGDDYCVAAVERFGSYCTSESELTIAGLRAGHLTLNLRPAKSSDYVPASVTVDLADGQDARITVPVTLGGRVNTLVLDRATGEPVHRACVTMLAPGAGGDSDIFSSCTNKQGKLTTYAMPEGAYQMFVRAPDGLGAQWVTDTGGTGDQREATKFRVKAGKTAKAGTVSLDKAGTVGGVVRDPAGRPVPAVTVDVLAVDLGAGPASGSVETDEQGRYTFEDLGPYAWPVLFTPAGTYPRQWSGGLGNRFQAQTITVRAGAESTYDMALSAGSRLTGDVTVAAGHPAYAGGRLTATNVATGDQVAIAGFPGRGAYDLPVIGGNPVKLGWYLASPTASASGWWQNATDLETATKINVPGAGTKRVDLTIG